LGEEEVNSQEQVGSTEETSVQTEANGFNEATQKTIVEASKPHLPHKSLSWEWLAKGASFCCGGSEKLPEVRRLDDTLEHARVSFRSAEETSVQEKENGFDEAMQKTIAEASKSHLPNKSLSWGGLAKGASFCCGGLEKLLTIGRLDNNILEHTIISFCFGGPEKLPAVRRPANTIRHAPFCCEASAKPPAVRRTDNTIVLKSRQ